MYRSEYIVCFRSEISFVPLLFSHRTPFLRPYWQIYFNSTSNHNRGQEGPRIPHVVSYFNSTSNHNFALQASASIVVVSYFNSTSNHNFTGLRVSDYGVVSYFNSTSNHNPTRCTCGSARLFLISILHQTTTLNGASIDPIELFLISILHQTTTILVKLLHLVMLFLISILHQTTTGRGSPWRATCCFLFQFYIKPQRALSSSH